MDDRKYTKWYNQEFLHSLLDDLKFIHEGFVGLRFIYLADHSELPLDNLMKNNFEIAYEAKVGLHLIPLFYITLLTIYSL